MSLTIHGTGQIEGMTKVNIAGAINVSTIATLVSANTVAIGAANSNTVYVTGTISIAGYDIAEVGIRRTVIYTGITTLLHNSVSHIVRGGVNKTTGVGDSAEWISLGGGNWFMLDYTPANVHVAELDRTIFVPAASGVVTLDLSLASVFNLTLSGNTTLALSNVPALNGETLSIVIVVSQGATPYTLTWFNTMAWRTTGGVAAPAPAANKTIEYVITSIAAGNYIGRKGAST